MKPFNEKINGPVYSYDQFMNFMGDLVKEGNTSGLVQSQSLIDFTALNYQRMKRLNKTLKLEDGPVELLQKTGKLDFWVITEAWCGDSAQVLPVFGKIRTLENVSLNIILRDKNPHIIDKYLTNGGRSIPKVVAFDENGKELFDWGPRPENAQKLFLAGRSDKQKDWEQLERDLHKWYAQDKTKQIQSEMEYLLMQKLAA